MASSALGYRLFRLRRLVAICLGLTALAVIIALWLIPGSGALQVVIGCGLFSIFAMAQLAMIIFWPTDMVGPLTYATGLIPVLAATLPFEAYLLRDPDRFAGVIVLSGLVAPVVWLILVPICGNLLLHPLNWIIRKDVTRTVTAQLPMTPAAARAMFAIAPDRKGLLSDTGPMGWDGTWQEHTTRLWADPATGKLAPRTVTNSLRTLHSDEASVAVIAILPGAATGQRSIVIHQTFVAMGQGSLLTQKFQIDRAQASTLLTGWLADSAADQITAKLDALTDNPPRAIAHLPMDTMWATMARFFRWGDSAPDL
jgi:hypothetical protein